MEEVSALLLSEMEKKMSPKRTLQAIASSISRFEQPWGIKSRTFREEKPRPLSYHFSSEAQSMSIWNVSSADRKTNACCGGGLRKVGRLDRGFHSRNSSYPSLSQASSSIDVYRKREAAFFECLDILPKKDNFSPFLLPPFSFLNPKREENLTDACREKKKREEWEKGSISIPFGRPFLNGVPPLRPSVLPLCRAV